MGREAVAAELEAKVELEAEAMAAAVRATAAAVRATAAAVRAGMKEVAPAAAEIDRKSTRLNSSHLA